MLTWKYFEMRSLRDKETEGNQVKSRINVFFRQTRPPFQNDPSFKKILLVS